MEKEEMLPVPMYGVEFKLNDVRHLVMCDDYDKVDLFAHNMLRELSEGKGVGEILKDGWELFIPFEGCRFFIAMQDRSKIPDTVQIMTRRLIATKE